MLGPAHHGFNKIAVIEIDRAGQVCKVLGGKLEGGLRQVDAVIVADLRSP